MNTTETLHIKPSGSLDGITVYFENYDLGRGMVTIICYGAAWSCFFGAMSGRTIRQFVAECDTPYLVNKLGCTQWLKQTKNHEKYLGRVIDAVKAAVQS